MVITLTEHLTPGEEIDFCAHLPARERKREGGKHFNEKIFKMNLADAA